MCKALWHFTCPAPGLRSAGPKALTDLPAGEFEVVVGMGCGDEGCPMVKAKRHEEWGIPDPKEMPPEQFRQVRDLIEAKVKELVETL